MRPGLRVCPAPDRTQQPMPLECPTSPSPTSPTTPDRRQRLVKPAHLSAYGTRGGVPSGLHGRAARALALPGARPRPATQSLPAGRGPLPSLPRWLEGPAEEEREAGPSEASVPWDYPMAVRSDHSVRRSAVTVRVQLLKPPVFLCEMDLARVFRRTQGVVWLILIWTALIVVWVNAERFAPGVKLRHLWGLAASPFARAVRHARGGPPG
jgi:hypothetical protein